MTNEIVTMTVFVLLLFGLSFPGGIYLAAVFNDTNVPGLKLFRSIEKFIYSICRIDTESEMTWKEYAITLMFFNILGIIFLFFIQIVQGFLPLNPEKLSGVPWYIALNTAISFVTNTNWQSYVPETTVTYFTQMVGLTVQNFLSAAVGLAVAVALIRGIVSSKRHTVGNFWVDIVRITVRVLLPLSVVFALLLVSQGVIQNFNSYQHISTLNGEEQIVAMGPIASQEAIKEIGTNGGGPLNANSAHPFENPTPVTNFLEALMILLIPASLVVAFGRMAGDKSQGHTILLTMFMLFVLILSGVFYFETAGNPLLPSDGGMIRTSMEGKELRFGTSGYALFSTATTVASCGAVDTMHDSLNPLSGMLVMMQIMLGEVIFGGVGSGLYGMLIFVFITVFIIGLMVGRTPEYLGKKVESKEIKLSVLAILAPSVSILVGAVIFILIAGQPDTDLSHNLTRILYACASTAGNNGSAFAGLDVSLPSVNILLALLMFIGRFGVIIPVLAIAGSMAEKTPLEPGPGTFPTGNISFVFYLSAIILIIGILTFVPALVLGPVLEHLKMIGL